MSNNKKTRVSPMMPSIKMPGVKLLNIFVHYIKLYDGTVYEKKIKVRKIALKCGGGENYIGWSFKCTLNGFQAYALI